MMNLGFSVFNENSKSRGIDMANAIFFPVLADLSMASHQHVLPPADSWKAPQQEGKERKDNYVNGVTQSKWGMGYDFADGFMTYFKTQDAHTYHTSTASTMTVAYKTFIYTMISAVDFAFNQWRLTLKFSDLKINGPVVVGKKGCLKADGKFYDLFKSYPGHSAFVLRKHYAKWRDAVGKGVENCLKKYIDNVMVPGFPWYPAYAAFPAPAAAPMPNVTWPLISCPSFGLPNITVPEMLKKAMLKEFDDDVAEKCHDEIHKSVFEAIAMTLAPAFLIWVSTQTINGVIGSGQIPTFAPPVVPAGPVVNGSTTPSPAGNLVP